MGGDGRLAAAVPDIVLYRAASVLNGAAHLALFAACLMTFCLNLPRRPPVGR